MDIELTEVFNFEGAFRGMRNPMNSWQKSDSLFGNFSLLIGEEDLQLARKLVRAGSEHAKFLRQIMVSVDITAPLYWWKEFDTYKVGTVANSTSTMHKLTSAPITKDMFEFDEENEDLIINNNEPLEEKQLLVSEVENSILYVLEQLRQRYVKTKSKSYWRALIQLLPDSYLQRRTITLSYANLRNIYFQRRNHKLKEWTQFCYWIETLPYSNELITLED